MYIDLLMVIVTARTLFTGQDAATDKVYGFGGQCC